VSTRPHVELRDSLKADFIRVTADSGGLLLHQQMLWLWASLLECESERAIKRSKWNEHDVEKK